MKVIIYLLGLSCIGYCTYFNLYTRQSADSLKKIFQSYPLRYLAVIPALLSVLFLISAPAAVCPWLFWIVGILAAIEAVVAFINPKKFYSRMIDWLFENTTEQAYRVFAIIGIIFGTLIMTLAK